MRRLCSVFELIDLYTPSTKLDQYVGYLKVLHRAIVKNGREWRFKWPTSPGDAAAIQLRDGLLHELRALVAGKARPAAEGVLADVHSSWCQAERVARAKARAEEEEEEYTTSGGGGFRIAEPLVKEVSYRYFRVACACTLTGTTSEAHFDPTSMVFRRLDIDGNGTISLADLRAVVLNDEPSSWFMNLREVAEAKRSNRRHSLKVIAQMSRGLTSGQGNGAGPHVKSAPHSGRDEVKAAKPPKSNRRASIQRLKVGVKAVLGGGGADKVVRVHPR